MHSVLRLLDNTKIFYSADQSLRNAERYRQARDRYITSDADILGGTPVIAGTRLTVYAILGRLQDGDTVDDLAADYPELSREAFTVSSFTPKPTLFEDVSSGRPAKCNLIAGCGS